MDAASGAPKGIFPFYTPRSESFLGAYPLSSHQIVLPDSDEPLDLQIEPEVGLFCKLKYSEGSVISLQPIAMAAFNDCSIRRPGAMKISEKKNWGADSKGVADVWLPVTDFERDGPVAAFRIASFLRRDGELHEYGVDSPLPGYSYFGQQLLDWIAERIRVQRDEGPLEDVGAILAASGNPPTILIGIGATRYTEFGEKNFLEAGDDSIVVLYDGTAFDAAEVRAALTDGSELENASVLIQRVVGP